MCSQWPTIMFATCRVDSTICSCWMVMAHGSVLCVHIPIFSRRFGFRFFRSSFGSGVLSSPHPVNGIDIHIYIFIWVKWCDGHVFEMETRWLKTNVLKYNFEGDCYDSHRVNGVQNGTYFHRVEWMDRRLLEFSGGFLPSCQVNEWENFIFTWIQC